MPVFNDFSHYYVGGGHPSTPSYTSSGYAAHSSSSATSSPYSYPTSYSNRAHSNYFPSNYPSSNLLSTITGSGITARYYTGNKKNSNYTYKGTRGNYTDKYSDTKTPTYTPSPYTTYSLWKENQIASKWRNDNYRWNHLKDGPRTTKPVYIDTAKINVNKPRTKRQEPSPPTEPIPERSVLVEKPMVRDEQLGTIKRGRTVVRMHTKMLKENPYLKKNEKSDHSEAEEELECRFNRMSPVRISRLKKRSVLQYKRHDSGNKHWLDSESSDNDSDNDSIARKSTVKSRRISRSGTIKREDTIKNKDEITREDTVKRRYNKTTHSKDLSQSIDSVHKSGGEIKKTDRRLSLEMYEEQTAILDSMIKAELAREDADDYFSDPKRGTVKIKGKNASKINTMGQSTDSNTDEEDTKKKGRRLSRSGQKNDNDADCASEKSTPSSSRRNSLFQDLIIGETISENFIEDLENKIQNSYTNTEKVLKDSMPKLRLGTVKITQKLAKKPSRFDIQPSNSDAKISSIVEVEEKPKTPKFFIEDVKIEASKFSFDGDKQEASKKYNIDTKTIEKIEKVKDSKETTNIFKKEPIVKKIEDKKVLNKDIGAKEIEKSDQVKDIKETNILKKDVLTKNIDDKKDSPPQLLKKVIHGTNEIEKNDQVEDKKETPNILKKDPPIKKTDDNKESIPPVLNNIIETKENDKRQKEDTNISQLKQKSKANIDNKPTAGDKNNMGSEINSNATKITGEKLELAKPEQKQVETKNVTITKADAQKNENTVILNSNKTEISLVPSEKTNDVKVSNGNDGQNVNKVMEESSKVLDTVTERIQNETHLANVDSAAKETLYKNNLQIETSDSKGYSENENTSSVQNLVDSTQKVMNVSENNKTKAEQVINLQVKVIKPPTKDVITKTQQSKTPLKGVEKTPDITEVNQKSKSSSPKVSSTNKTQKDTGAKVQTEPAKKLKSVSPDKSKKDVVKPPETPSKSPPKEDGKLEEKGVKTKPKINLESNKKIAKMKDEKPERKTVKGSKMEFKSGIDENRIVEKVESAEEKSEQSNQKRSAVQMTAKKSTHKKKESSRPRKASAIVHMKPRAMAIRTVENHPPSLKTPRLFPLPQPTKAVIEIIPPASFDESESSDESDDESTATEGSSDECSDSSSDSSSSSLQGNQRNSTSSLDSGFGSACYKTKKGIALQIRIVY